MESPMNAGSPTPPHPTLSPFDGERTKVRGFSGIAGIPGDIGWDAIRRFSRKPARPFLMLFTIAFSTSVLLSSPYAAAGADHPPRPVKDRTKAWKEALAKPSLAVTAVFDRSGRLWRASLKDGRVLVSASDDLGKTFGPPVPANVEPETIIGDGENRPKIVVAQNGHIYVSYTQALSKPMSGNIRFSRSVDGGKSFSPPITVNDERGLISHRFDALAVDSRGRIHIVWLDKRDLAVAEKKGEKYKGTALYAAVSGDGGATFGPNVKLADHACECCRVAIATDPDGTPVVLWRQIFGKNVRDHAMMRLDGKFRIVRASHDNWEIDACPHHGPALSIGKDGVRHFAWFTAAGGRPGIFYARTADGGGTISPRAAFGRADGQASRPQVLSLGEKIFLAWKELDGEKGVVRVASSQDGGKTWSDPRTAASTSGASDYPLLIANGREAFLSWNTAAEGYRLISLERGQSSE